MNTIKLLKLASQHYQAGNLQQAADIYKKILTKHPENINILNLLGVTYSHLRRYDCALRYLERALHLESNFPETYNNLGIVFCHQRRLDDAITSFHKAIDLNSNFTSAYNNLGITFQEKGDLDAAVACFKKALQTDSGYDNARYNLATALQEKGQFDDAIAYFQELLKSNPHDPETYNNLGVALRKKGQLDDAIACFQKALQLNNAQALTHYNLGYTFMKQYRLEEAVESFRSSLQIDPDSTVTLENLGNALVQQGKLDEGELFYRRAIQRKANYVTPYQALLMIMNYRSRYDPETVFAQHLAFAKQHAEPLFPREFIYSNDCSCPRRLKIGYVSPDFRKHSVAYYIEPLLAAHSHEDFEIYCYSDVSGPDEITKRIGGNADHWHSIVGVSDERVANLIRSDAIDILIDLAGHTANNRILVFARKPAPIQASWIGYPATTGLSTIDYKIVDHITDPPGLTEQYYTEELIRLQGCFLCYLPYSKSPEIGELPALKNGHVTFGSFNNFAKVSSGVISVWARILKKIPESRLIMKAKSFADRVARQTALSSFTREGITEDRITLLSRVPSIKGHLDTYNGIDIGLDTFPYNGTTTSCEALWMGVPVITLAGNTHASRVGVSILSNVGLPELVARTPDEYVTLAVDLARNVNRMQSFREHMRDMMVHSPLCDARGFTEQLEMCYRMMWDKWCRSV
jgi:predicted O-linked N-acetylglucosamine transferase (SPINDLY family)